MANDYLTCGDCQGEFLLNHIMMFIEHKKANCERTAAGSAFPSIGSLSYSCWSCPQKFAAAISMMKHAQRKHNLPICVETESEVRGDDEYQQMSPSTTGSDTDKPDMEEQEASGQLSPKHSVLAGSPTMEESDQPAGDGKGSMRPCCAAVIPKKRQRHIQSTHVSNLDAEDDGDEEATLEIQFDGPSADDDDAEMPQTNSFTGSGPNTAADNSSDAFTSHNMTPTSMGIYVNVSDSGQSDNSQSSEPTVTFSSGSHSQLPTGLSIKPYYLNTNTTYHIPIPSQVASIGAESNYDTLYDPSTPQRPNAQSSMDPVALQGTSRKKRVYPTTRPFKCDQCMDSFNQRVHLRKHRSKHTGVKPFKCGECDYSTVERSHLKVHIRIHTGEKPFKCTYCEYATAQNSTLKIHLKRRHAELVTMSCSVCGKNFPEKEQLSNHEREHGNLSNRDHVDVRRLVLPTKVEAEIPDGL